MDFHKFPKCRFFTAKSPTFVCQKFRNYPNFLKLYNNNNPLEIDKIARFNITCRVFMHKNCLIVIFQFNILFVDSPGNYIVYQKT